ncbi:MAG: right-handed parallel beta-helix repeat-containing protein [Pseudomonadota bacterium]
MRKLFIYKILLILFLLSISRTVIALNFAVDNTGGGTFCVDHSGSGGNFATLAAAQAAANVAGGPHTIDICPGVGPYIGQAGAMAAANYNGLTIQGTTGVAANVTVNPVGNNEVFHIQQPGVTIQHLTTNNGGANGEGIEIQGNNAVINNVVLQNSNRIGLFVNNSTGVTLSNLTVSNMGRQGIYANGGSTNLTINSPVLPVTSVTTTGRDCIRVDSANLNLNDVTLTACTQRGLRIRGANAAIDDVTISNTTLEGILLEAAAPLLNQDDTVNNTITVTNSGREGIRSTNAAANTIIDNLTVNTTGANFECAELRGNGDGVTVNFQNLDLSNCGREGLWMRNANQVADDITVNTTVSAGRECMEVDGADSIVTNLDLDNCAGIGLRLDGARVSATTIDINTTGAVGLRFDGADVTVTTADITNTTGIGLLVSGNDGTVNGANISNVNNTGMRIENARADIDSVVITDTRIHGVQITQNDADINDLTLTNIGTYLAGNAGADGITTTNRRVDLTDVTINDARDFGIHFNATNNNHGGAKNFTDITIKDTGDDGIFINRSTNNLTMDNINISNSTQDGIRFNLSDRATVTDLDSSNNTLDGVYLATSRRIFISDSTIDNNQDGVTIFRSRQNRIFDSTISNNTLRGFELTGNGANPATDNRIYSNIIQNNGTFGLRIQNNGGADNDDNRVYENCFNNPAGGARNAVDFESIGAPAANIFDFGGRGNFWDDDGFTSPGFSETCPDVAPANGICDTTYPIPTAGRSVDNNPLTSCSVLPIDHYDIDLSASTGITCEPISVTITAKDSTNATVAHTALTTIDLATSTSLGDWVTVTSGTGTLNNSGLGVGDYEFPIGEGSVTITFSYTSLATTPVDNVNFNITSTPNETTGTAPGDTDPGDGTDDPSIDFREAIFRVVDSTNTPVNISTKLSGKQSNTAGTGFQDLYLQAIETVTATECTGTFESMTATVELASECNNPTACETVQVEVEDNSGPPPSVSILSNSNGSVTNYTGVTLDFDADSKTPLRFVYDDAGQITLHARYDLDSPNGVYMSGESNPFIVKPAGICVENIPADTAAAACTPASGTCSTFRDAGELFDMIVRGVTWESDADTDFCNGAGSTNVTTPNFEVIGIEFNSTVVAPAGLQDGNVSLTSIDILDADKGTDTDSQSIDEVGVFTITASGDNTAPATAITYLSETIAPSTSINIGRFTPYIFDVTSNTPVFESACGTTFGYIGQPFTYSTAPTLTVTPHARGVAPAFGPVIENYTGDFFKITQASLTIPGGTTNGYSALTGTLDLGLVPAKPTVTDNLDGTATLLFSDGGGIAFNRSGPIDNFDAEIGLQINVIDTDTKFNGDGDGNNVNPEVIAAATAGNGISFNANKDQRWGRLILDNTFGSELLPLEIPVRTEYQSSGNFVTNTDDNCTAYTSANITFSNHNGITAGANLTATGAGTVINGVDDDANPLILNNTLPEVGFVDATHSIDSWLQYDWDNDTNHDNNPFGRATWGIFAGPDEFIFIREPW